MDGIRYIVDEKGRRTHAVIDLKKCKELWEDLEDYLDYFAHKDDPKVPIEEVETRLRESGKLHG